MGDTVDENDEAKKKVKEDKVRKVGYTRSACTSQRVLEVRQDGPRKVLTLFIRYSYIRKNLIYCGKDIKNIFT
jgi:hypothetical protein